MVERTLTPRSVIGREGPRRTPARKRWTAFESRLADGQSIALIPLALFLALALLGPWLGNDPTAQDLANRLQPPVLFGGNWEHPLGTDSLGRDVLARILVGARLSLIVGLVAASISAVIGVSLGLLAGNRGGSIDTIITAVGELSLSVPTIVIGIVLVSTLGQSITNLLIILVISGWLGYARVVRIQARNLVHADFITGAVALGATRTRIAFVHVLPNVMPQVIVLFCQQVAAVMLWEASLTYLGIGLPIERISLGGMIREGQEHVFDGWWIAFIPGLAIALAVIGFNLLADWLQHERDPARRSIRGAGNGRAMRRVHDTGECRRCV
ncbi:MAG: ABC transporter permease [Chloroflexota bacterium]|nr:ABC transporter permease [Chloroflexota bacterium]